MAGAQCTIGPNLVGPSGAVWFAANPGCCSQHFHLSLSCGRWVFSTQVFAAQMLLQMSEPKFPLFNFRLLILSLLVLHFSFPGSFLLVVFHLP